MLSVSKGANENYLCKIITCNNVTPLKNSDFLSTIVVDYQPVVVGRDTQEGEVRVWFPPDCLISPKVLSPLNEYRVSDSKENLNKDKEAKGGFFESNGRVRALKIRGQKSFGYTIPVTQFQDIFGVNGLQNAVGTYFDTINGVTIVKKYIRPEDRKNRVAEYTKDALSLNRLVDGQVTLHGKTLNLRREVDNFELYDKISIHEKYHGTSFGLANVLVKRKLNLVERLVSWGFGFSDKLEYDVLAHSRNVIKNRFLNHPKNKEAGYHKTNPYMEVLEKYGHLIPKGYHVYGEIVGYESDGTYIQAPFDYGCDPKEKDVYLYRIAIVNPDGVRQELSNQQIKHFCDKFGFKMTPFHYEGTPKGFLEKHGIAIEDNWRDAFIKKLEELYNGNTEPLNKTAQVPAEGIVVRNESYEGFSATKLKDFTFLENFG